MKYKVVEKFESINGEGQKSGELAIFIRLQGCNLKCSYCDTMWANTKESPYELMTKEEILEYILDKKIKNVTLTGGEPLKANGVKELLEYLILEDISLEIETNGSVELTKFLNEKISFTMDYKLPSSNMEKYMNKSNLEKLLKKDTLKFVVGSENDLVVAKNIIDEYDLIKKTNIYFSPVFGKIELSKIVEFLIDNKLNGVKMQLQMHKFIWDKDKKGV